MAKSKRKQYSTALSDEEYHFISIGAELAEMSFSAYLRWAALVWVSADIEDSARVKGNKGSKAFRERVKRLERFKERGYKLTVAEQDKLCKEFGLIVEGQ